eukprot:CAMPEP_0182925860 /NCGR_PEP_ID=MMETSP0105_2-20130417/10701_1 /TAXON_ID=81532 ORGANISM="Acanthoeca-like sp., Strain 10tr" /NCGR_SAMPLE_ID=MMETSP0105_2 /ASSEMBLY_ACC=CAM_ASM_000205 /LENGTH=330 /DNA_ID=CAMNT_0025063727 /DNA_START=26 /DNA_END=1014 /DNA_ORIENTATION=+
MVKKGKDSSKGAKGAKKASKTASKAAKAAPALSDDVSAEVKKITLTVIKRLGVGTGDKVSRKEVQAAIEKEVGEVLVKNDIVEDDEVEEEEDDSDDGSDDDNSDGDDASDDSDGDSDDDSDDDDESSGSKRKAKDDADEPAAEKKSKVEPAAAAAADEPTDHSVFIGGISWGADDGSLQEYLNTLGAGAVTSVRIMTDRETGRSKGFGYADCSATTQGKLCAMTQAEFMGRVLRFDGAEQRKGGGAGGGKFPGHGAKPASEPADTLFVGNLAFNVTEDEMYSFFEGATNCRVATDRNTGEPRGFGHVSFGTVEEAQKAMDTLAGSDLKGR